MTRAYQNWGTRVGGEIPSGYVEPGEAPIGACEREVKEKPALGDVAWVARQRKARAVTRYGRHRTTVRLLCDHWSATWHPGR
ncbi:NUDIX domain-containing protein [Nocardioides sp. NPDC057767]|uniref:NUDIX domain-containing protein n=1 Tax=unclassified Nocardioides TaxID=2615069 RepID=UPI0036731C28